MAKKNGQTKTPQVKAAQNTSSSAGKRQGQGAKAAHSAPSKVPAKATPAVQSKPAVKSAGQKSKSSGAVKARGQSSERPSGANTRCQKAGLSARGSKHSQGRTASGKVPKGRTLTTRDKYLDKKAKEPEKERPVVVIETNEENELAVVQLSTTNGKDRTRLPKYQQGQSRFKHYVEIEDSDGEPIKVNVKFKENHPNMDVAIQDVDVIIDTVLNHSKPMQKNRQRIKKFRGKKE